MTNLIKLAKSRSEQKPSDQPHDGMQRRVNNGVNNQGTAAQIADKRPKMAAQRTMQAALNQRPQIKAQKTLHDRINSEFKEEHKDNVNLGEPLMHATINTSPRMLLQRQQMEAYFGEASQRTADNPAFQSEPANAGNPGVADHVSTNEDETHQSQPPQEDLTQAVIEPDTSGIDINALSVEAVLSMPAASRERDRKQMDQDVSEAEMLTLNIIKESKTTAEVENYFPRIQERFQLKKIAFQKLGQSGSSILISINPVAVINADALGNLMLGGVGGIPIQLSALGLATTVQYGAATQVNAHPGGAGLGAVSAYTLGASIMQATVLGPEHPQGSRTNGGAGLVNLMPQLIAGANYIKGHLLNANLGGPGTDDRNLFPITNQANALHNTRVETPIKQAVNDDQRWVTYTVTVQNIAIAGAPPNLIVDADFHTSWDYLDALGVPLGGAAVNTIQSRVAGGVSASTTNPLLSVVPANAHLAAQEPNPALITPELATNNPPAVLSPAVQLALNNTVALLPAPLNPPDLYHQIQTQAGFGPNRAATLTYAYQHGRTHSWDVQSKTTFTFTNNRIAATGMVQF